MLLSDENEAHREVVADFVDREVELYASGVAVRAADNAPYQGTSQIQRLIIGRALTGVSAFT